jgi:hypothetical protein
MEMKRNIVKSINHINKETIRANLQFKQQNIQRDLNEYNERLRAIANEKKRSVDRLQSEEALLLEKLK